MKKYSLVLILVLLLSSCVIIKELIPRAATACVQPEDILPADELLSVPDNQVIMDEFYITGYPEPHTPPLGTITPALKTFLMETAGTIDLNRSKILRFKRSNGGQTRRIIIMSTGIYSGAGTIANLCRGMVKRMDNTEVWLWERRSNALEDRRLIKQVMQQQDTSLLTAILEPDSLEVKPGSFYQPSTEDIAFVGYWGLEVMLGDLYNIIAEARSQADEIILGGYSMGGLYVSYFLANDFDKSDKVEAGYTLVDRAMVFDGPVMVEGYVKNERIYRRGTAIIPWNMIEGVDKLESGKYYPCNGDVKRDFSIFMQFNIKAALAALDPEGISPARYKKWPATNMATFFLGIDDDYQMFKLFTVTCGTARAKHNKPFSFTNTPIVTGPLENESVIGWNPRKSGDEKEYQNAEDYLAESLHKEYDMADWYQPTRIMLEIGSVHSLDTSQGWQSRYFNFTQNSNVNIPLLCIGLTRGLNPTINSYLKYMKSISSDDVTIFMMGGISHIDGGSLNDNNTRQYFADIVTNWFRESQIISDDKIMEGCYIPD